MAIIVIKILNMEQVYPFWIKVKITCSPPNHNSDKTAVSSHFLFRHRTRLPHTPVVKNLDQNRNLSTANPGQLKSK